jgi:hypothetical protein
MNDKLARLIRAARNAERSAAKHPPQAPFGLSTRVASRWSGQEADRIVLLEKLAWRGLVCSALICLAAVCLEKRRGNLEARSAPAGETLAAGQMLF